MGKVKISKLKDLIFKIAIVYVILSVTSYYWEGKLGLVTLPVIMVLLLVYLILILAFISQLVGLIRVKFNDKKRMLNGSILLLVLLLTFTKPYTFLKLTFATEYLDLEDDNVLVGRRYDDDCFPIESFKLKSDFTFKERNTRYALTEVSGKYKISNDTIYFEDVKKGKQEDIVYAFGLLEELEFYTENKFALVLYVNKSDKKGYHYSLVSNKLKLNIMKPKK